MRESYRSTTPTKRSPNWQKGALLAAIGLVASALYVRSKTRQAEREHPPQGKFIEVDGVRLHYLERGEGPVVVMLHGNAVYSVDFQASGLLDQAAEHYRVIAFDRPGYGYSERPRTRLWTADSQARLLCKALQEMGVDSAIVLGHSWGALVAVSMGLQSPELVRGLVLLGGYYYPNLRVDAPAVSPLALPVLGDLLRYTISPIQGRLALPLMAKTMFSPRPVPARFSEVPPWMMLRPVQLRASAADAALMIPSAMTLSKRYARLQVPSVVIAGTQDAVVDFTDHSERLHDGIGHSELHLEPGVGHMTHYAHPGKVLSVIDAIASQTGMPMALRDARADALARASESGL